MVTETAFVTPVRQRWIQERKKNRKFLRAAVPRPAKARERLERLERLRLRLIL